MTTRVDPKKVAGGNSLKVTGMKSHCMVTLGIDDVQTSVKSSPSFTTTDSDETLSTGSGVHHVCKEHIIITLMF